MRARSGGPAPHETAGAGRDREAVLVDLAAAGSTPILEEYRRVKAEHPDALVLARLGDFYELMGSDAEVAAPILGVTLTSRGYGAAGRLPMCGVPHHAASGYIRRLLDAGHRVALWDQVGEVVAGKLVRREVTRVLSPGTAADGEYLEETRVARCVALCPSGRRTGIAAFDPGGGEMLVAEVEGDLESAAVRDEVERLDAAELVVAGAGEEPPASLLPGVTRSRVPAAFFDATRARERVCEAAAAASLEAIGLDDAPGALGAAGALLAYCERARLPLAPGFVRVRRRAEALTMRLDAHTRRNLELVASMGEGGVCLAQLLDRTRTPMGSRLLRARVLEPLTEPFLVGARLDAVAALVAAPRLRDTLGEALAAVRDLERLVGRCVQRTATPRDLAQVRGALAALPAIADILAAVTDAELSTAAARCVAPEELAARLRALLVDEPPPAARDGGCIRLGADTELDELFASGSDARAYIAGLEERERARSGIQSLRVGYNRVFGYYLEVGNAHAARVPVDYVRKQTLVGAERYITADLKEQETLVLGARERALAREQQLLDDLVAAVAAEARPLLDAAAAVAVIDVNRSLAVVAAELGWVRPEVDGSAVLDVEQARHPLVEHALGPGRFVANDVTFDAAERIVVLTGPNMAGKSTYLRQVALVALLAQVGSFVPAARARVGVCDRIFTRIGAHDDLSGGMSTFMVEMAETALVLRHATPRSLVILDEIGRGTSTYDGLAIAQAVVEHIHDSPSLGCRTLFATHYHELTALAASLPRLRNARVEVLEEGDGITFVHRIVPGGADRSYGVHVARLAGVPAGVVARARQLLAEMERAHPGGGSSAALPDQLDLGIAEPVAHPLLSELAQLDIEGLTPLAALNKLAELRQRAAP
ncbi:MAG: DNA mismatch repair protein MutS [Candidatus Dormibacteria bacterium]